MECFHCKNQLHVFWRYCDNESVSLLKVVAPMFIDLRDIIVWIYVEIELKNLECYSTMGCREVLWLTIE